MASQINVRLACSEKSWTLKFLRSHESHVKCAALSTMAKKYRFCVWRHGWMCMHTAVMFCFLEKCYENDVVVGVSWLLLCTLIPLLPLPSFPSHPLPTLSAVIVGLFCLLPFSADKFWLIENFHFVAEILFTAAWVFSLYREMYSSVFDGSLLKAFFRLQTLRWAQHEEIVNCGVVMHGKCFW